MVEKTYEVIDYIENSDLKKRLDEVKEMINESYNTKKLIESFNDAKVLYERYNTKDDFIRAKVDLLKDPFVKEYVGLQNKINLLTIKINERISKITKGATR